MMHGEENTIVSLGAYDGTAVRRHCERIPASPLQISCAVFHNPNDGRSRVLRITGTVDSSTSHELLEKIQLHLGTGYLSQLTVDLEAVARIDSSGIGVLLTALRDSQKRGVRFTLCGLSKPLHTMLERMHLASLFEIRPTLEKAFNL